MNELLLIVSIAGSRVALPAAAVESVVELESLIPVPRAPSHLAGLSALRSRVLTVIDCQRSLELGTTELIDGELHEAAVVELDGHYYALTVDAVEDVVEALSDPAPIRAAIRRRIPRRRTPARIREIRSLRSAALEGLEAPSQRPRGFGSQTAGLAPPGSHHRPRLPTRYARSREDPCRLPRDPRPSGRCRGTLHESLPGSLLRPR